MALNLTYLTSLKTWLNVKSGDDDVVLTRLINQVSMGVLNYLQRPSIFRRSYKEMQDGVGNQRLMLRNWPVVRITSLTINGQNIPAASGPTAAGYTLATWDGTDSGNPQEITLFGYSFCRGQNNIAISYEAGYCIESEPHTIPSTGFQVNTDDPMGSWAQDDGVVYGDTGAALIAIPWGSTPAAGQYAVSSDGTGTYLFSASDTGRPVLISYSFIPAPLEEATIEWIGERYRYKDRIGQSSKTVGGQETSAYYLKMPDHIQIMLEAYKKWLPL